MFVDILIPKYGTVFVNVTGKIFSRISRGLKFVSASNKWLFLNSLCNKWKILPTNKKKLVLTKKTTILYVGVVMHV
jgi:hypothetical protein